MSVGGRGAVEVWRCGAERFSRELGFGIWNAAVRRLAAEKARRAAARRGNVGIRGDGLVGWSWSCRASDGSSDAVVRLDAMLATVVKW